MNKQDGQFNELAVFLYTGILVGSYVNFPLNITTEKFVEILPGKYLSMIPSFADRCETV